MTLATLPPHGPRCNRWDRRGGRFHRPGLGNEPGRLPGAFRRAVAVPDQGRGAPRGRPL